MGGALATVVVGLVSGVLSGAFGIGGGMVTTPAIRLLLGYPALVAVGTPLPVIIPGALTGAVSYARRHLADLRAGLVMGLVGSVGSVAGALASAKAGGTVVLLATAALIAWAAADMLLQQRRDTLRARAAATATGAAEPATVAAEPVGVTAAPDAAAVVGEAESDESLSARDAAPGGRPTLVRLIGLGLVAGLYSGFLGLGGGFVIVPGLTRFCDMPVKRAIGTSLVTIAILAVPGTVVHSMLGHIWWPLALLLAIGVVPGAMIGARLTEGASDRVVRLSFALLLAVVGVWLAVSELGIHL
jgi:uncharacterized membrane protein YfcA